MRGLEGADGAGDEAVVIVGFSGEGSFEGFFDFGEKHDRRDAERVGFASLPHKTCQGPSRDAGHGGNGSVLRVLVKEHRQDEIRGGERGLTNHRTDRRRAAVAAGADHGEEVREWMEINE